MAIKNINHFDMLHVKEVEIFKRSPISKIIDVEFYKLLSSLGGKKIEKYYSNEVLDNFKDKYSINNVDEFISVFSKNVKSENINDVRSVLFYILSSETDNIFRENYKVDYIIDKRLNKPLEISMKQTLNKGVVTEFYDVLFERIEKDFDYKTAAMMLQIPKIYFDNVDKYKRGANIYKTLLQYINSNNVPFDDLVYSCYSCVEYINYVYEKVSIEDSQVKEYFSPIKDQTFEFIENLIGNVDVEIYKEKNPLIYFMIIALVEIMEKTFENKKNSDFINKMLMLRNIGVDEKDAETLCTELNISKEIIKCIKFFYMSASNCEVDYVEYMSIRDEIEYLYKINFEENIAADYKDSLETNEHAKKECKEAKDLTEKQDTCDIIEPELETSDCLEENNEAIIDETATLTEHDNVDTTTVETPRETIPSVPQNSLYEVLLAMGNAKESVNVSKTIPEPIVVQEQQVENTQIDISSEKVLDNEFTFTWI